MNDDAAPTWEEFARTFADHLANCDAQHGGECTCGFDAMLDGLEQHSGVAAAKAHLHDCLAQDGLFCLGWYLGYTDGRDHAVLDGEFTADDLDAIACYMRSTIGV